MGTNYYYRHGYCPHCGSIKTMHIGKQSAGHPFNFKAEQVYRFTRTFEGWDELLKGTRHMTELSEGIFDEYGNKIPYEMFIKMPKENGYIFIEADFS